VKYALLLAALVACSPHGPQGTAGHPEVPDGAPRLVVLVVIDQWPEWSFEQKRSAFHSGFERLLSEGEWRVGEHPSAATLTAETGVAVFKVAYSRWLGAGRRKDLTRVIGDSLDELKALTASP